MLMKKMEEIVLENKHNIDFIFLVTHNPKFYERLGYSSRNMSVTWLKIYQEKNIGVGTEIIDDCFLMHKSVNGKVWSDGELDMLGYWY